MALRKQIAFDLMTDKNSPLFQYYNSLSSAYKDIEKVLGNEGFQREQGSVFISKNAMDYEDLSFLINNLCEELPWLSECIKGIAVTNVGKEHDLMDKINVYCEMYSDKKEEWIKNKNSKEDKSETVKDDLSNIKEKQVSFEKEEAIDENEIEL